MTWRTSPYVYSRMYYVSDGHDTALEAIKRSQDTLRGRESPFSPTYHVHDSLCIDVSSRGVPYHFAIDAAGCFAGTHSAAPKQNPAFLPTPAQCRTS